MVASWK